MGKRRRLSTADSADLRTRAEEAVGQCPADFRDRSPEENRTIFHELEVHQIELEMQNQALREAQQELEASRDRYADLYDFAPAGYMTIDAKGQIDQINLTAARLLRIERGELTGRPFSLYVVRGHKQRFHSHLRDCQAASAQTTCELMLCPKEGPPVVVELDTIRVEKDKPTRYRTTITDITRRKQAEDALRLERDKLGAVIDIANVGIGIADPSGTTVRLNTAGLRLYGLTSEAQALALFDRYQRGPRLLYPDGRLMPWEDWPTSRALRGEYVRDYDVLLTLPGCREQRFVSYNVVPVYDGQDRIALYVFTMVDLTERKRAEDALCRLNERLERLVEERTTELRQALAQISQAHKALKESEQRYRAIVDNAIDGILLVDPESMQLLAGNQTICEMLGYPCDELECHTVADIQVGPSFLLMKGKSRKQKKRETTTAKSIPVKKKDGSIFYADVNVFPISLSGKKYLAGFFRDITERKQLESTLAEGLIEERRRFSRDLHDGLGQELTGLGYVATLLHKELQESGDPRAEVAQRLAEGMQEAIHSARGIAQGIVPVDAEPDGLAAALERLAAWTQTCFGIACCLRRSGPVFVANHRVASELFRIAQEAVTNAARHARARQIEIELRAEADSMALVVRDDGTGLPDDRSQSTGMGLQLMRFRAGLIGAVLDLHPGKERGTEVSCVVPRGTGDEH